MLKWFKELKYVYLIITILYIISLILFLDNVNKRIEIVLLLIDFIYTFFVLPAILYVVNSNMDIIKKIIWVIKLWFLNIIGFILFYENVYKNDSKKI